MIEEKIFYKHEAIPEKLKKYGFVETAGGFEYRTVIMDETLELVVTVDRKNKVTSKIYDLFDNGEEYTTFRVAGVTGAFAHKVKETHESILKDIDEKCFRGIENSKHWICPANTKYYDIVNCFNETDEIIWKQSTNIQPGDVVYLYASSPVSAILYKCKVLKVNIPYDYKDENLRVDRVMEIKLLKRYNNDEFTFSKLNDYGVKAIRGPRSVPRELLDALNM